MRRAKEWRSGGAQTADDVPRLIKAEQKACGQARGLQCIDAAFERSRQRSETVVSSKRDEPEATQTVDLPGSNGRVDLSRW